MLLAFVAMLAWEGYNHAQAATDQEASLVQSVYQLVDGLTGPEMTGMRADIRAYADAVTRTEWPAQEAGRDIGESDLWADFRYLAERFHLRSCWSKPIFDDGGEVLGTFAIYYRECHEPSAVELAIADHLAERARPVLLDAQGAGAS